MYTDSDGHFPVLALIILGIVASGTINGLAAASSRIESESFWGAFTGGFIDGAIGAAGIAAGLAFGGIPGLFITAAISFAGGMIGNTVGQLISYGNAEFLPAVLQGGISAVINSVVYAGIAIAEITEGARWVDRFIDGLKISAVGLGASGFFAYYSLPSTNSLRKNK